MKQFRFILNEHLSLQGMISKIKEIPEYKKGWKSLLQVVEQDCIKEEIQRDLDLLVAELPQVMIVGMTSHGAMSKETHSIRYTVATLLLFEKSDVMVGAYDCHEMSPENAGESYQQVLKACPDCKGVLLMSADFSLDPSPFIDQINAYDETLVVFGGVAGTKRIGNENSLIYVGNQIYDRGILAVAFFGKDLMFTQHYNLGFKPLGKELTITKSDDVGMVYEINGKPAFDIYREHLGIGMNDYFFENASTFPFMFRQNGYLLARVALDYKKENGALAFAVQIPEGTAVSLGYATDQYLLEESEASARQMFHFHPEAVLIYACMSRRMLMGDDLAEMEFDFFESVNPDATWAHGYAEILHADGLRGILNASLVAVGMREGEVTEEEQMEIYQLPVAIETYLKEVHREGYLPLSTRLVKFLESTTEDLRSAVNQLFRVASLDELTQVYNRRSLNYFLNQHIENLGTNGQVMVMLVDIDHFKRVNDTYGHDVGDFVLKEGVDRVKSIVTQKDIIGRWGGEEFVMISPYSSAQKAVETAELLRESVQNFEFDIVGHITVSCGVTLIHKGDTSEDVFKRIDDALYEAKETGRNKVIYR